MHSETQEQIASEIQNFCKDSNSSYLIKFLERRDRETSHQLFYCADLYDMMLIFSNAQHFLVRLLKAALNEEDTESEEYYLDFCAYSGTLQKIHDENIYPDIYAFLENLIKMETSLCSDIRKTHVLIFIIENDYPISWIIDLFPEKFTLKIDFYDSICFLNGTHVYQYSVALIEYFEMIGIEYDAFDFLRHAIWNNHEELERMMYTRDWIKTINEKYIVETNLLQLLVRMEESDMLIDYDNMLHLSIYFRNYKFIRHILSRHTLNEIVKLFVHSYNLNMKIINIFCEFGIEEEIREYAHHVYNRIASGYDKFIKFIYKKSGVLYDALKKSIVCRLREDIMMFLKEEGMLGDVFTSDILLMLCEEENKYVIDLLREFKFDLSCIENHPIPRNE